MESRARASRAYRLLLGAVAALAIGLALILYATDALKGPELDTVDTRFSIRGTEQPSDDVAVVGIDDVTQQELGIRFPFPRRLHAKVIDRLHADGAEVVAFDVEFLQPTTPKDDEALIAAIERAQPVVLADSQPNDQGESGALGGEPLLSQIGARGGNPQFEADEGDVFRRVPLEVGRLRSFPIAAVEAATGKELSTGDLGGKSAWIDFAGPPGTYPAVSFSKVLRGEFEPGTFAGKTVVVGASDPALKDVHPTSTAGDDLMSGPEIEANAIATGLDDFPLQSTPAGLDVLLIVVLGGLAPALSLRLRPLPAIGSALAAGLLYAVAAQLAFGGGWIVPVIYPLLALAIAVVGSLAVYYALSAVERQRVRDTFARFVPEGVVDEALERADEDLRLGGKQVTVTVMFSDIRGFTSFAEGRDPEQVLEVLNRYHEEMVEAIMEHGGTLISFMGDGIMATFGAPIEQTDHADRALAAAREMLEIRLPRVNEWLRQSEVGTEFRIGVGLNSGPVMAGNLGSKTRIDYATIGDTTNTASRLEEMTKEMPHSLLISETTKQMLAGAHPELEFADSVEVRGRQQTLGVYFVR